MGKRHKKKRRLGLRRIFLRTLILVLVLQAVYLGLLRYINPPLTLTQLGSLVETKGLKRDYVPLSQISDNVRLAVMSSEDQLFASHVGFDWQSVRSALDHNEKKPSRLRGASTITQQVAKNVFLWQQRSWIRKGLEAYFTVLLELTLDKRRILELYLNVAEMGPGIFGIEAAADHYFGKSARSLTRREAALITACLPNPKIYHPDHPSPHIRAKTDWILNQMAYLRTSSSVQKLLR